MKKLLCLLLCLLFLPVMAGAEEQDGLTIHFLEHDHLSKDGKAGDCSLIIFPDGAKMLVDCGVRSGATDVWRWLLSLDAKRVDYFVASHVHSDHVGALDQLLSLGLEVGAILESEFGHISSDAYPAYIKTLSDIETPRIRARAGDVLTFGGAKLEVLWPLPDKEFKEKTLSAIITQVINNASLVFRVSYGDFSMLYTGDIYFGAEDELIAHYGEALRSTAMKVPHHGHTTSSGPNFLAAVNARVAVATGRAMEVATRVQYKQKGIDLYITYENLDVTLTTDGSQLRVSCEDGTSAVYPLN